MYYKWKERLILPLAENGGHLKHAFQMYQRQTKELAGLTIVTYGKYI